MLLHEDGTRIELLEDRVELGEAVVEPGSLEGSADVRKRIEEAGYGTRQNGESPLERCEALQIDVAELAVDGVFLCLVVRVEIRGEQAKLLRLEGHLLQPEYGLRVEPRHRRHL